MSDLRPRFDRWADVARLDPQRLAAQQGPLAPDDHLAHLHDLMTRLPLGLFRADAVFVQAEAPLDRTPLAQGSAWFPCDAAVLTVVDTAAPDGLDDLLSDLAAYAALSAHFSRVAQDDPPLVDAASGSDIGPPQLRLVEALGTSLDGWQRLDETHPGLRDELASMLRAPFQAPIHLHPHVRPGWLAQTGRDWAERLRAQCPSDRPWLLVGERDEMVELLSPYVRDLGSALGQWARENPNDIRMEALLEAWAEAPEDDLAAMVVPDLFRVAPELVEERRGNERRQGLFLEDRAGTHAGFAEIGRLAAPDRNAIPAGARGVALVAAGGPTLLRTAMVEAWLDGPVSGLAGVFEVGIGGSTPILPDVVADDADAFIMPGTGELRADAATAKLDVATPSALLLPRRRQTAVTQILGQFRRRQLLGEIEGDAPVWVAFAPAPPPGSRSTLRCRKAAFEAARLVLRRAFDAPVEAPTSGRPSAKNPRMDGLPRRFRA